jgi:hypothetical protein
MAKRNIYITTFIVLLWAIMTGLLVKREVLVTRLPLVESQPGAQGIGPADSWMGVYFSDTRIGFTHSTVRRRPASSGGGYRARNVTRIRMSMFGNPVAMFANVNWTLDDNGKIEDLKFALDTTDALFTAEGKVENGTLRLKVSTGETEFIKELPIGENIVVSDSFSPLAKLPDMEEGVEYAVEMLDPVALVTRKAKLRAGPIEKLDLGGESVEARRVEVDFAGITAHVWGTPSGEIVKVDTPVGLVMIKEPPEVAMSGADEGEMPPDLASAAAIPAGMVIEQSHDVERMVVRFEGVALENFDVWDDAQRIVETVDEEKAVVEVNKIVPEVDSAPQLPISDGDLAEFVGASPFIQSEDPRIIAAAREVIGDETNSWKAALKLAEWVDATVENEAVASVPSAVDVLHARKGDCNEHTVLYVAMARAVGLPARADIGIVYQRGSFYYHAWPEVYAGKWVRMDPTLGQDIADATHIKLSEGELYRWAEILPAIRQLKLEVTNVDYGGDGSRTIPAQGI